MTKAGRRIQQAVAVTEKPVSLAVWPEAEGRDTRAALEEDVRALIRQLAEAKFAVGELERQHTDKTKALLLSLLDVMDGFERVFRSTEEKPERIDPSSKNWINRFRTVSRMLNNVLAEQGVVAIEILQSEFDPKWHKVAELVVDNTRLDGTIVQEAKKGYLWRDQILRKSEVIVVHNKDNKNV